MKQVRSYKLIGPRFVVPVYLLFYRLCERSVGHGHRCNCPQRQCGKGRRRGQAEVRSAQDSWNEHSGEQAGDGQLRNLVNAENSFGVSAWSKSINSKVARVKDVARGWRIFFDVPTPRGSGIE